MSTFHILVVDDNVILAGVLKEHFEYQGYRVTVADRCAEAEGVLRGSSKVDLMILDYLMPDGHGTDLIHSMAEDNSLQKPPIVMSSSFIDPNSTTWKALYSRLPTDLQPLIKAYVGKPYSFEDMDPKITTILSGDYQP